MVMSLHVVPAFAIGQAADRGDNQERQKYAGGNRIIAGFVTARRRAKKYLLCVGPWPTINMRGDGCARINQRGKVSKKFLRTGLELSGRQQAM